MSEHVADREPLYDDERTDEERAAWRTPLIPTLDEDTLLYVRESIAGVLHVRAHPLDKALDIIDEIVRLRREHPVLSAAETAVLIAALAQPAVPVAGAEEDAGLDALAHKIAEEWTPHDHDPAKCADCAALPVAKDLRHELTRAYHAWTEARGRCRHDAKGGDCEAFAETATLVWPALRAAQPEDDGLRMDAAKSMLADMRGEYEG